MERINFRFRKLKDDKLREAFIKQMEIERLDASEIVRKALALYLYSNNTTTSPQTIYERQNGIVVDNEPMKKFELEDVQKSDEELAKGFDNLLDNF